MTIELTDDDARIVSRALMKLGVCFTREAYQGKLTSVEDRMWDNTERIRHAIDEQVPDA